MQASATLSPCPFGIDTSNNKNAPYSAYISGTGVGEPVVVVGGTCTPGAESGTIVFTPANSHAAGYIVQSASGGIQEAINDAGGAVTSSNSNARVLISPPSANIGEVSIYAPVFVHASKINVSGYGAMVKCLTRSYCFHLGDLLDANHFDEVRVEGLGFDPGVNQDGAQIVNFARQANVVTISTSEAHGFVDGDVAWVWIKASSGPGLSFHGMATVLSVPTANSFTFKLDGRDVAATNVFGWTALENAAIEDNAEGSVIEGVVLHRNGSNYFHQFLVVDNDQHSIIRGLHTGAGGVRCTANFCGNIVLGRGDARSSGVIYVQSSELSLQCQGNGVASYSGNSLHVSDSVIEGFNQYGVYYDGGLQPVMLTNVYQEVGSCTNPMYPGSLQAAAGLVTHSTAFVVGGSPLTGQIPQFASTGATRRNYYVVPKSTGFGAGPFLLAGFALTNLSGRVNVYWPQIPADNNAGAITYDVIYTTGITATPPYAGAATVLASGVSGSCANGVCTYADTLGTGSAYKYEGQRWVPELIFWPNNVVISERNNVFTSFGSNTVLFAPTANAFLGEIASGAGTTRVSAYVNQCSSAAGGSTSPVWIECLGAQPIAGAGYYATVLEQLDPANNGPPAQSKGRLNFPFANSSVPYHLFTLADSDRGKTLATPGHRPSSNANDCFVGFDDGRGGIASAGLSFGCAASISNYVANVGDGASWLERLTASLKTFKVPITTNSQVTSTLSTGTPPLVIASRTPVANLTVSNHPKVQNCGTATTCSANATTGGQIVFGTITLAAGSATLTGVSPAFTNSTSFNCVANDKTNQANGVKAVPASGNSVTFTGTGSDVISYQCMGN